MRIYPLENLIKTNVKIDKLRTLVGQPIPPWGKAVSYFQLIEQYEANTNLNIEETRFYQRVLSTMLRRGKFNKPLGWQWGKKGVKLEVRSAQALGEKKYRKECLETAKLRTLYVLRLYKQIKHGKQIEPINVGAKHNGTYVISDGNHREGIGYMLGFTTIPAKITWVDPELNELIKTLKSYWNSRRPVLYEPIDHPIFKGWKCVRSTTRWPLIKKEFDWKGKTILDIGCFTGYFSHKIAQLGAKVTGLDANPATLHIARKLNTLLQLNVNFVHADMFQYLKGKKFDCIIFFSVLHHTLKLKGMKGVKQILMLISLLSPVMFLETPENKDIRLPSLVISSSKYKHFQQLGTNDLGRRVFKFTV